MTAGPVRDLTTFADALRHRGMTITPDQVSDMARSLALVDLASRDQVYAALRCMAITDPAHRVAYDEEFHRFFGGFHPFAATAEQHSNLAEPTRSQPLLRSLSESTLDEVDSESGASATERIASKDFANLDENELAEARKLVLSMLWQPSDVRTRRWASEKRGHRPDMRRTLHNAVGPEGDLMRIRMRHRTLRQRPLIIIADISGSMDRYAEMFLVFAHAARQRLRHVEAFTFSTHLTRITEDLKRRNTGDALRRMSHTVDDWSGGTKIGEAIRDWNKVWSRRMARGGPVVMVLSDGWDCGDPQLLSAEMAGLARSVHRVLWLNPLAARSDYQPVTQGMRAVLPYIDHLLPAASVNDLRDVVRLLETSVGVR
jgi:uncharacterized protein